VFEGNGRRVIEFLVIEFGSLIFRFWFLRFMVGGLGFVVYMSGVFCGCGF